MGSLLAILGAWTLVAVSARADDVETARREAVAKLADARASQAVARTTQRHPDYVEATRRNGEIAVALERAGRRLESAGSALASADRRPSRTGYQDAALVATGALREYSRFEELVRQAVRQLELERRPPPPPPPPPPPRKPARPPRVLIEAAGAFVAGDYAATVERLAETRLRSREAQAHVHLLRAAARYALFLLGGESDFGLRGEAIEDVLACRAADPDLAPVEDLFSPRFRQFFEATR